MPAVGPQVNTAHHHFAQLRPTRHIARRARHLRAPAILAFDPGGLCISFERMEGWSVLTKLLRSRRFLGLPDAALDAIMRNTGRALAEYHAGSCKIHGDFDPTNILFRVGEPRICLIDFSRPDFADHPDYCRGSIYRDLALLVIHLLVPVIKPVEIDSQA